MSAQHFNFSVKEDVERSDFPAKKRVTSPGAFNTAT